MEGELQRLRQENQALLQALEEARQQLEGVIDFPHYNILPVLSFSVEGTLIYANPAKQQLLPSIQVLSDILPEITPEECGRIIAGNETRQAAFVDQQRHYQLLLRGVQKLNRVLAYGFDDTALVDLNELLRQKVIQANQANEAKDQFLAAMSHELRTPLSSIIGNGELLLEHCSGGEGRELVDSVLLAGRNQLALVNDILYMSKIQSGKFTVEESPYDFAEMLAEVTSMSSDLARTAGLELVVDIRNQEQRLLLGDRQRLVQVLINLLGNAIKFTPEGRVTLTTEVLGERLYLTVQDTGIGMDVAFIKRLFSRFEQADGSIARKFGGAGLGLYISLSIAEMMGGTIDVTSELGEGSTFELILPYRPTQLRLKRDQGAEAGQTAQLHGRVLVVEDTPAMQLLISRILTKVGVEVVVAGNGIEGVEALAANRFDLVLMDMQMPEMDGIEATRQIRARGDLTPIYALTANVMPQHRDAFLTAGCNGFLSKPIDRSQLLETLQDHLPS